MLPQPYRLPANLIADIARRGRTVRSELFDLRFVPSRNACSRFAIVTSKKLSPKATIRNRIRRRVRAALMELIRSEGMKKVDALILCRNDSMAEVEYTELVRMLGDALAKA